MSLPFSDTFAYSGDIVTNEPTKWAYNTVSAPSIHGLNPGIWSANNVVGLAYWIGDSFSGVDDQYVSGVVDNTGSSYECIALAVRCATSAMTCYVYAYSASGAHVYKYVNGTQSTLISGLSSPATGTTVKLEAAGSTVSVYYGGTLQGSATDGAIASGIPGVATTTISSINNYYTSVSGGAVASTITLGPSSLPGGTVGVAYSETISASGGTGPYTFAVSSGSLPPGLTLSSAGLLSGTPTTAGSYSFTVKAADTNSNTGTQPYSGVTILAASYGWEFYSYLPALMWLALPANPSHLNSIAYAGFDTALDVNIYSSATQPTGPTVPSGATLIAQLTAAAGSGWQSQSYGGESVSGYLVAEFLSPGAVSFYMPEITLPQPGEAASAYMQGGGYPLPS